MIKTQSSWDKSVLFLSFEQFNMNVQYTAIIQQREIGTAQPYFWETKTASFSDPENQMFFFKVLHRKLKQETNKFMKKCGVFIEE